MARLGKKAVASKNGAKDGEVRDATKTEDEKKIKKNKRKSHVKIYKKLTVGQAQKIDALKRRKQIITETKKATNSIIEVKKDIKCIFNNATLHKKIVKQNMHKQNENLRNNLKPTLNLKRQNAIPWKPTPSNTVNVLFDGKPKVHEPFEYKSPLEWKELLFLSPRSFQSHEGREKHEKKKPAIFKKRVNFKNHVAKGTHDVFQYHRPLSARRTPEEYEAFSKRRQRPATAMVKRPIIQHKQRERVHKHFRYHLHSKHMTTFKSTMAEKQETYDTILLQRAMESLDNEPKRPNIAHALNITPSSSSNTTIINNNNINRNMQRWKILNHQPKRPQTARSRFSYIDDTSNTTNKKNGTVIVKRPAQRTLSRRSNGADEVLQTRAYGHYDTAKETLKHDDVIQAFLVSKSDGVQFLQNEKMEFRDIVQNRANALLSDRGKTLVSAIKCSEKNLKVLNKLLMENETHLNISKQKLKVMDEKVKSSKSMLNMAKRMFGRASDRHMRALIAL
jgi:hypothetical protein